MGVHCEAVVYLSMVNAQVAQGTRLHLVDSGSSVFTSPHKDTLILSIKTTLKLTGVGGVNLELMSPLVYTVLDTNGAYVVLHYQAVYHLSSVPIARMTAFHWLVERTHANPTILGRRELVKQVLKQENMGGVTLVYTPELDSSEQRTLLSFGKYP
jgi:hypothetical protein